jgi:glycosyltransferase involved in cell wall biosynthesis
MNILVLANKIPYPPNDGGAFATLNMCMGLSNAGARVTLLAMTTPKHPTRVEEIPNDITEKINVETIFVDTTISAIKALINFLFSSKPYNAVRFESKDFTKRLKTLLESNSYDLVQLEGLYVAPYIGIIRARTNSPIALRAHNVEHEIWERTSSNESSGLKRFYYKHLARRVLKMERKTLGMIDILIPISERDGKILMEMGFSGLNQVVPTGYDIGGTDNEGDEPLEFPSVFHLGGLDWNPNREGIIWFLENCWTDIHSTIRNVKFYVAGRGAPDDFMKRLSTYPGVVYCGEVDNARRFMRSKALMIVPLLSGSGMRIKIVEGMALGKAVLSTSIGAEGIEADHDTQIVIADDPVNFTFQVINLLSDRDKLIEIGKNAQLFAKVKLDNNRLTQNLFDFYKQVIGE